MWVGTHTGILGGRAIGTVSSECHLVICIRNFKITHNLWQRNSTSKKSPVIIIPIRTKAQTAMRPGVWHWVQPLTRFTSGGECAWGDEGRFPQQVPQQVPGTPRAADPTQSVSAVLFVMKTGNQEAGTRNHALLPPSAPQVTAPSPGGNCLPFK